ncbi:hypothetical protein, partial [Pseudomonas sp. MPR-R5A]|uniref:hypothetical protein n=1 Tax=Pseudomonas sp. MPR-R5A TaxID=2070626 RepID=UPI001C447E1D
VFCVSLLGNAIFDFNKLNKRPLRSIADFLQTESEFDLEKYIVKIPSMLNRIADLASPEEIERNKSKFRYNETIKTHCWT